MGPNVCKCYPGYLVGLLLFALHFEGEIMLEISISFYVDLNKPMEITLSTNYSLMTLKIHVSTSDRENSNLSQ